MHGGEIRPSAPRLVTSGRFAESDADFLRRSVTGRIRPGSELPRNYRLYHGDCVDAMATLPADSVDSIVCDPPYGLSFMSKGWDDLDKHGQVKWHTRWLVEAIRVLKPGGHLIAFSGTRTAHHLGTAMEQAGFEIRDTIHWCYWSGFPKGTRIDAQIDRQTMRNRETGELEYGRDLDAIYVVTKYIAAARDAAGMKNGDIDKAMGFAGMAGHWTSSKSQPQIPQWEQWATLKKLLGCDESMDSEVWKLNGRKGQPGDAWLEREVTGTHTQSSPASVMRENFGGSEAGKPTEDRPEPVSAEAKAWKGWNSALKPAIEPAIVARKPFIGSLTANVIKHGTGAINVDACRMAESDTTWPGPRPTTRDGKLKAGVGSSGAASGAGSGVGAEIYGYREGIRYQPHDSGWWPANLFYCSKPGRKERDAGLDDFVPQRTMQHLDPEKDWVGGHNAYLCGGANLRKNNHATVKPIKLMRWLQRLVTPVGGVTLSPFLGSGTDGCAAMLEGFDFIGMELYPLPPEHENYDKDDNLNAFGIAEARIVHWRDQAEKEAWANQHGSIFGAAAQMDWDREMDNG